MLCFQSVQRFLLYVENGEVVEIRQRFEALCLEEMLDGGLVDESDAESGEEGESGSNVAGKRGYDTMTRRSARRGGAVQEEEADTTVSLSEEADAIPDIVAELADIMGRVASQVTSCLRAAYPNNRSCVLSCNYRIYSFVCASVFLFCGGCFDGEVSSWFLVYSPPLPLPTTQRNVHHCRSCPAQQKASSVWFFRSQRG